MALTSCLYTGYVRHRRSRPRVHDFRYAMTVFCLDLDELDSLDRWWPLFGVNRPGVATFYDRDHADAQPGATKAKIVRWLQRDGVDLLDGRIRLVTACRLFGYVFNPVSFYFCDDATGCLRAVVAEVTSTFGERFLYTLKPSTMGRGATGVRADTLKEMHVSPFLSNRCRYTFTIPPPSERLAVGIVQYEDDRHVLDAQLWGERRPLTMGSLARLVAGHPWLTVKTTLAIHAEAFRLYLKGVPVVPQPPPTAAQRRQRMDMSEMTR